MVLLYVLNIFIVKIIRLKTKQISETICLTDDTQVMDF